MVTLFAEAQLPRLLKLAGFDYIVVDCEHGTFDYSGVARLIGTARAVDLPCVVRIPEIRREVVLKFLEMGAAGLLLPNTESVEQAKLLVEYAKYAPQGNRGVSLFRPHSDYQTIEDPIAYMAKTNDETVLIVQIESKNACERCEAILGVPGIDVAFIGPGDLSQSLGIFGQVDHPEFVSSVALVLAAARQRGKQAGIHVMSPDAQRIARWVAQGMTLNLWINDVLLLMNGAKAGLSQFRPKL